MRLEGDVAATLRRKAVAGGARAIATIVHVAPDAEASLDAVRGALNVHLSRFAGEVDAHSASGEGRAREPSAITAAASAWNGMLIARILAADARGPARHDCRGPACVAGRPPTAAGVDVLKGTAG